MDTDLTTSATEAGMIDFGSVSLLNSISTVAGYLMPKLCLQKDRSGIIQPTSNRSGIIQPTSNPEV